MLEKPGRLQFGLDLPDIVIAVRRSCEEPGRVRGKDCANGLRHDLGELVFFDAIPNIEQKPAASFKDTARFPIGADPIRKEHRAELTDNRVEALSSNGRFWASACRQTMRASGPCRLAALSSIGG